MKRESKVSTPLMTKLRKSLIDLKAEVIKHYEAAMIGCPDCSVTVGSHNFTLWLEFKLWIPTKEWSRTRGPVPYQEIAETEKGVQLATARRLHALYVVWVNKSRHVSLWNPNTGEVITIQKDTKSMARFIDTLIREKIEYVMP